MLAALLLCSAAGLLVGWLSNSPLAGVLCSAAFGLGAMMLSDTLKANRLLAWLRADAEGPAPGDVGVWGEIAHLTAKVLFRRDQRIEHQRARALVHRKKPHHRDCDRVGSRRRKRSLKGSTNSSIVSLEMPTFSNKPWVVGWQRWIHLPQIS